MASTKQIVKESTIQKIQKLIFDEDGTVFSRDSLEKDKTFRSIVKNHMNKYERENVDEILNMIYKGKSVKQIQNKFNDNKVKPEKKIAEQAEEIEHMSSDESIFMLNGLKNVDLEGGVDIHIGKDESENESDNVVESTTENESGKVFVMSETVQNIKDNKKSENEDCVNVASEDESVQNISDDETSKHESKLSDKAKERIRKNTARVITASMKAGMLRSKKSKKCFDFMKKKKDRKPAVSNA